MHKSLRECILKGLVKIGAFNIWNTPNANWLQNSLRGEYCRNGRGWHIFFNYLWLFCLTEVGMGKICVTSFMNVPLPEVQNLQDNLTPRRWLWCLCSNRRLRLFASLSRADRRSDSRPEAWQLCAAQTSDICRQTMSTKKM